MALTFKDFLTTLIAAGVFGVYYTYLKGINVPLFSNYRIASLILLIVGVFMCAFGSRVASWPIDKTNPMLSLSALLGFLGMALGILGIITGNRIFVIGLIFDILLLWGMTTLRHAFVK